MKNKKKKNYHLKIQLLNKPVNILRNAILNHFFKNQILFSLKHIFFINNNAMPYSIHVYNS